MRDKNTKALVTPAQSYTNDFFQARTHSLVAGRSILVTLAPSNSETQTDLEKRFGDIIGPEDPVRLPFQLR